MGNWLPRGENPADSRTGIASDLGFCALGRIRTCGLRFRKPTLYPLSYEG